MITADFSNSARDKKARNISSDGLKRLKEAC